MSIELGAAIAQFTRHFGASPTVAAGAPGRVNIIGEHTDYNGGFVLPMAIERGTAVLARPNGGGELHLYAGNLDRFHRIELGRFHRNAQQPWADYIAGVAKEVAALGKPLEGAEMLVLGDVPIGCGLSSSASLEMAALAAFEALGGFVLEGRDAAKLGQRVENDFMGLSSGIMDQFIARMAEPGHALLLDCRSLDARLIPARMPGAVFVILSTGVARGLTASKYNERVSECMQAARLLGERLKRPGDSLRPFDPHEVASARAALPEALYRRARHVVSENARTLEAAGALASGDPALLGRLMKASHESLRDDYEVSCPELDTQCAIGEQHPASYGSRMTGAGFGGCTLHLVQEAQADAFAADVMAAYREATGLEPLVIRSHAAGGAWRQRLET